MGWKPIPRGGDRPLAAAAGPRTAGVMRTKTALAPAALDAANLPHLGLLCITFGPEVRYRTVTRTRFLSLDDDGRRRVLNEIYRHNVQTLFAAVDYCHARGIRLYRV